MNNRKIRTFRYIENNRFGDWMKERMITSQWGRSTEDKNHKDSPAEKKMLNEIEAYFNIMHTYAYRELTYENEFFSKAPVKSKLEVNKILSLINICLLAITICFWILIFKI